MKQKWIWKFILINHNIFACINMAIEGKTLVTFMIGRISQEHSTIIKPIFQFMINAWVATMNIKWMFKIKTISKDFQWFEFLDDIGSRPYISLYTIRYNITKQCYLFFLLNLTNINIYPLTKKDQLVNPCTFFPLFTTKSNYEHRR